jgi:hypothetical protein
LLYFDYYWCCHVYNLLLFVGKIYESSQKTW